MNFGCLPFHQASVVRALFGSFKEWTPSFSCEVAVIRFEWSVFSFSLCCMLVGIPKLIWIEACFRNFTDNKSSVNDWGLLKILKKMEKKTIIEQRYILFLALHCYITILSLVKNSLPQWTGFNFYFCMFCHKPLLLKALTYRLKFLKWF